MMCGTYTMAVLLSIFSDTFIKLQCGCRVTNRLKSGHRKVTCLSPVAFILLAAMSWSKTLISYMIIKMKPVTVSVPNDKFCSLLSPHDDKVFCCLVEKQVVDAEVLVQV